VSLDAPADVVGARLAKRAGHFFPADLLASQYRDLEAPDPDEHAPDVQIAADSAPDDVVADILASLG
jgi:gluconokinase